MVVVWIAIGGAVGAMARAAVGGAVNRWAMGGAGSDAVGWRGTWLVNVTGAFGLGVLMGSPLPAEVKAVLATGVLGAYTTFSTWMVESLTLAERGRWRAAALNVAGPVLMGPPLVVAGMGVAGWLL